jgi:hypothetical protein
MYPHFEWDRIESAAIARLRFTVADRDLDLGTITRAAPARLAGRVYREGAAAGMEVPRFSFVSPEFGAIRMTPTLRPDGTFELQAAHAGVYRFVPEAPATAGLYVESVTSGGRDVLKDGLLVNGGQTGFVNVVLGYGAAMLEGTVHNASGAAVANAMVLLIPPLSRRGPLTRFQTAVADGSGKFAMDGIPPGEYRLLAVDLDERRPPSWEAPDFVQTYEGRGDLLKLAPASRRDVAPVAVSLLD